MPVLKHRRKHFRNTVDPNCVLLLPMTGADESTSFPDISLGGINSPHTISPQGGAQIDTSVADPFGVSGGCGLLDGTADYWESANDTDWNLGSADWTIETWMRPEALSEEAFFDRYVDNNNRMLGYLDSSNINFKVFDGGTKTVEIVAAHGMSTSAWKHIAIVLYGNTLTAYVGGVSKGTDDITGVTIPSYAASILVGADRYNGGLNAYANGRFSDYAITKRAKYIGPFSPPSRLTP